MSDILIERLSQALAAVMMNPELAKKAFGDSLGEGLTKGSKALSGATDAAYIHGPGGMFSTAGIDNVVINAHMTPRDIDSLLPVYPTVYTNPVYASLTGFSEDPGEEPSGVCEECIGGTMQGCEMTSVFGRVCRSSDEIEINRVMQMLNRGETTPLTVLGDILGPGGMTVMPSTPSGWLEVVTRAEMVKTAVLMQRKLVQLIWQGNPANNTANGGYAEWPGFEMMVGTGKVDITGVACGALDSTVFNFGLTDVAGTVAGNTIVTYLSSLEWYLRHIGIRAGLDPVKTVVCMRPELWFEFSAVWPCLYLTDRCKDSTGSNVAIMNDDVNVRLRDRMRASMVIPINGLDYDVVCCDGMTEEHADPAYPHYNPELAAGEFASSIFMIPLSVRGGMNVAYWEHMDYSKASTDIALSKSGNDFWTDGGRFFWSAERQLWCYKMHAKTEPRVILRSPHLAGRIDDIIYSPLRHLRSPFYGDPYFEKGGVSVRANPADSWSSEWNAR